MTEKVEGNRWDRKLRNWFKEIARELGLSNHHMQGKR